MTTLNTNQHTQKSAISAFFFELKKSSHRVTVPFKSSSRVCTAEGSILKVSCQDASWWRGCFLFKTWIQKQKQDHKVLNAKQIPKRS